MQRMNIHTTDYLTLINERFKLKPFSVNDETLYHYLKDVSRETEYLYNVTRYSCYANIPISFDIETSNFKNEKGEKVPLMYIWQMNIAGYTVIDRTWDSFKLFINKLSEIFNTDEKHRIIIYVHFLSFEFEFIKHLFQWSKVFAIKSRTPLFALTTNNIEFRCSYLLSGSDLDNVAKNLTFFKLDKLDDFDYKKVRSPETPLTDRELLYCVNDVKIVVAYIAEFFFKDFKVNEIPLTKTGFVREYVRKQCYFDNKTNKKDKKFTKQRYLRFIHSLSLTPEEYGLCKKAFSGGYTHANAWFVNHTISNVKSFDFTSSYPAVMVSEKFPMTSPEHIEINSEHEFLKITKSFNVITVVDLFNVTEKFEYEHYISLSQCDKISKKHVVDNGRVVSADYLRITITEVDFFIIQRCYRWSKCEFNKSIKFYRDYLPKPIINSVLKFYEDKTTLKNVSGREYDYLLGKQNLNSIYGCFVMDVVRDKITFDEKWDIKTVFEMSDEEIEDTIEKYNKSNTRFSYYPWGVYITAYARYNLWTAIFELKDDYIYSDTDSVKLINYENHINYFEKYNNFIIDKIQECLRYYNIELEKMHPQTIKGINKPLGVWDDEGIYTKFKTLGAKRYLTLKDGKYEITVAGLAKSAINYIVEYADEHNVSPFDLFTYDFDKFKGLTIPAEYTGGLCHTYIDVCRFGYAVDYLGNTFYYKSIGGVYLEEEPYNFGIGKDFGRYLIFILNSREGIV